MKALTIYRILSYLLLPVAGLLGIGTLMALMFALSNFAFLLSVFISGATVIYVFSSFVFLQKGITKHLYLKHSLKDLVKVNAYVAIVFSVMGLIQGVSILMTPGLAETFIENMISMQAGAIKASKADMLRMINGVLYFMLAISALLFVHINFTLRYLKQHADLFSIK